MIALWTRRLWPYGVFLAALVSVWLAIDAWQGRGGGAQARAAHQATVYAEHYVYTTDTLWQHDTIPLAPARGAYRAVRDSALRNLQDTSAVRTAFAAADHAFALDSTAIASAAATIRARDTLAARLRDELAIAQQRTSRLGVRAIALYDPLAGVPAASLEATLRLTSRLSLVARGDQRVAPGERPRGYLGLSLAY